MLQFVPISLTGTFFNHKQILKYVEYHLVALSLIFDTISAKFKNTISFLAVLT